MIQAHAGLQFQLPAHNLKAVVRHGESVRVAVIGIGDRDVTDNRTGIVFVDVQVVHVDRRGSFVHVTHRDLEVLGQVQPARILGGNIDAHQGRRFVIQAHAGLQLQLPADHFETVVGER